MSNGGLLDGSSTCRPFNTTERPIDAVTGGRCLLPFPIPQCHSLQTHASTSRPGLALLRASNTASTSVKSLKNVQSPPANSSTSKSNIKTFVTLRTASRTTNASRTLTRPLAIVSTSFRPRVTSSLRSSTKSLIPVLSAQTNIPTSSLIISAMSRQSYSLLPASRLSSILLISVTGLAGIVPLPTTSPIPETFGIGPSEANPPSAKKGIVVLLLAGILLGLIILILLLILFFRRRHSVKKQYRKSIGAIEKDRMFRPWKKSEMNLRRKQANIDALYPPERFSSEKTPQEIIIMPPPVFTPRRPNRSSSLYSGSILNGIEELSPCSGILKDNGTGERRSDYFDRQNAQSPPLSVPRSRYRSSGYLYSDDPFEAPLIRPETLESEVYEGSEGDETEWVPQSRSYKGHIRLGMGVQRRLTGESFVVVKVGESF